MYLNLKLLYDKNLPPETIVMLEAIRQNSSSYTKEYAYKLIEGFDLSKVGDYIKYVGKAETLENVRLNSKGKELLLKVQEPIHDEDDDKIFEWVCNTYVSSGKKIGNKKKVLRGITLFRSHTGIEKNKLALLLGNFLSSDAFSSYSFKLENIFYDTSNVFSSKFDIDACRLYQYYNENKEHFDNSFLELDKKMSVDE